MESKKSILIIASWLDPSGKTTQGSFILEQAVMFHKRGHKVMILYPRLKGTFLETIKNRKSELTHHQIKDIEVIECAVAPFFPGLRRLTYNKLKSFVLKNLQKTISANNFALIHSHSFFMGAIIGDFLSEKLNIPWFHTEHTSGFIFAPEQFNKYDKKIIPKIFDKADKNFFVSSFAMAKMAEMYNVNLNNCSVVSNVVSDDFFQNKNTRHSNNLSFISICSIIERKGIFLLLNAWKNYVPQYSESKLTIAGNGPLEKKIKDFICKNKLEDSVKLIPRLTREQVKTEILKSDVLVSASKVETFGLTVAEANALGKPVLVTDSGGVRDIVSSKTGIIVPQTIDDFYNGLIEMTKNISTYNPREINRITKEKFSEEVIYSELINHFEKN